MSGVYGFAVVRRDAVARAALGARLHCVDVGGLRVVAEKIEHPHDVTEESLRRHDRVVRSIDRKCDAVVPFRFGTWFAEEAELVQRVRKATPLLRASLALVRGCSQMTARLYDSRPTRRRPNPTDSMDGPGARYLKVRATAERDPEALGSLRELVAGLVRAERVERGSGPLVATVYHLVERGRTRAYASAVRRVASRIAPIRVTVSGPWPPYAFANIE